MSAKQQNCKNSRDYTKATYGTLRVKRGRAAVLQAMFLMTARIWSAVSAFSGCLFVYKASMFSHHPVQRERSHGYDHVE